MKISVTQKAEKGLKPESSMCSSHLTTPIIKFVSIPAVLHKHLTDLVSTPMGYGAGFVKPKSHSQIKSAIVYIIPPGHCDVEHL